MDENAAPRPGGRVSSGTTMLPTLLVGAFAFAIAAFQESAAIASPNNCGELPGIARFGATVIGVGGAALILVIGGIAAAIARRAVLFGAAAAIALAVIAGLMVGAAVTKPYSCASDAPQETRQVATLVLTMIRPHAGLRIEGPGECRRGAPGGQVREVVSDLSRRSIWVVPSTGAGIDLEMWPGGASPNPGANYLRVMLNDPAAGGFGIYADGPGAAVAVSTGDGSTGRISFTDLPPWSGNAPGAGLPATVSGAIEWTCTGPEE